MLPVSLPAPLPSPPPTRVLRLHFVFAFVPVYDDPNFPLTADGRVHHLDVKLGEGAFNSCCQPPRCCPLTPARPPSPRTWLRQVQPPGPYALCMHHGRAGGCCQPNPVA
jgi:hypothetical protein